MKIFRATILTLTLTGILACKQEPKVVKEVVVEKVVEEYPVKVTFPSKDNLTVVANLYEKDSAAIPVVLCHQARFNKIEYVKIAPKLNDMGFTCLAIDQRSGGNLLEWFNETYENAMKDSISTNFLDAVQDMESAVKYMYEKYKQPVVVWGSSYSSGLAIKVANGNNKVRAVISFSPGEYYGETYSLRDSIAGLNIPVFITSSKEEANEDLTQLISVLDSNLVTQFIPQSAGTHGSRALWETDPNNREYWDAVKAFLEKIKATTASES